MPQPSKLFPVVMVTTIKRVKPFVCGASAVVNDDCKQGGRMSSWQRKWWRGRRAHVSSGRARAACLTDWLASWLACWLAGWMTSTQARKVDEARRGEARRTRRRQTPTTREVMLGLRTLWISPSGAMAQRRISRHVSASPTALSSRGFVSDPTAV